MLKRRSLLGRIGMVPEHAATLWKLLREKSPGPIGEQIGYVIRSCALLSKPADDELRVVRLFGSGFVQVIFITVNTYMVANRFAAGVFVSSLAISIVWTFNVRKIAESSGWGERAAYALGAASGSMIGFYACQILLG